MALSPELLFDALQCHLHCLAVFYVGIFLRQALDAGFQGGMTPYFATVGHDLVDLSGQGDLADALAFSLKDDGSVAGGAAEDVPQLCVKALLAESLNQSNLAEG